MIPQRIYLQWFGEDGDCGDGMDCSCLTQEMIDLGCVTWCADKQWDSDVEYIRLDIHQAQVAELEAANVDLLRQIKSMEYMNSRLRLQSPTVTKY
jgi:hypothetical protein